MINSMKEIIDFLKRYKKVEWEKSKKKVDENGKTYTVMGGPQYDKRVVEIIKYLNQKYKLDGEKYVKFIQEKWYDWEIEDLELEQLVYKVYFIYQSERYCDGVIGKNIEDGTLLKIFMLINEKEKNA